MKNTPNPKSETSRPYIAVALLLDLPIPKQHPTVSPIFSAAEVASRNSKVVLVVGILCILMVPVVKMVTQLHLQFFFATHPFQQFLVFDDSVMVFGKGRSSFIYDNYDYLRSISGVLTHRLMKLIADLDGG